MADTDDKAKKASTPASPPEKTTDRPEPAAKKPSRTPVTALEKAVRSFAAGRFNTAGANRLLDELHIRGIEQIEDLQGHRLRDIREALRAAYRGDAHALLAAAEEFRKEGDE